MSSGKTGGEAKGLGAFLEGIVNFGLTVAGLFFVGSAGYLIYVLFGGTLSSDLPMMPAAIANQTIGYIQAGGQILLISGTLAILLAAIKFREDETMGYLLLFLGAALYWGLTVGAQSTLQGLTNKQSEQQALDILEQFGNVGMVAMLAAIPFIGLAFWYRLTDPKIHHAEADRTPPKKTEGGPAARIRYNCWDMGFCREHIRSVCTAYQTRKPCWRVKSGCRCDENLLLRAMSRSSADKLPEMLRDESQIEHKSTSLTSAQKRARCRQCYIYEVHQRQKYQLISPLVFPLVVCLLWIFYTPIKAVLDSMLNTVDRISGSIAFLPKPEEIANGVHWSPSQSSSVTADWVFIACLGLVIASYLLRLVEYLVFDLQV